jgi:hypothetical protein
VGECAVGGWEVVSCCLCVVLVRGGIGIGLRTVPLLALLPSPSLCSEEARGRSAAAARPGGAGIR